MAQGVFTSVLYAGKAWGDLYDIAHARWSRDDAAYAEARGRLQEHAIGGIHLAGIAAGRGGAAVEALAAKEAPLLLNGPIRITEKGMEHVIERHTVNNFAKFAGKSKFNEGESLSALVNSGTQQRMVQQVNGNFARTWDVGRQIGIDRVTGQTTSVMTVITRPNGELVTAFPGRP